MVHVHVLTYAALVHICAEAVDLSERVIARDITALVDGVQLESLPVFWQSEVW